MRRLPIPHPALLLVAAAVASDLFPGLDAVDPHGRAGATVALVVILFDGGASIGLTPLPRRGGADRLARARRDVRDGRDHALFLHAALGLDWLTAGLLAAAVAPTDPAVMFSVLGQREIEGRTDTVLEGESGANDPVGIALMLGLIELATHADASFWVVVRVFSEQMAIGLVVGRRGRPARSAAAAARVARSSFLMTLGRRGGRLRAADVAHGSGFLAVFVAGLIRGDVEAPRQEELDRLRERLASVAEVVVFVALGLTVHLSGIGLGRWGEGLLVAAFLALVARPLVCAALLAPVRLPPARSCSSPGAGLKGAVPILLAAYALAHHVDDAQRIYEIVFVVVLASVVVQGSTIPFAARRLGVEAS